MKSQFFSNLIYVFMGLSLATYAFAAESEVAQYLRKTLELTKSDIETNRIQRAKVTQKMTEAKEACADCWASESGQASKGGSEVLASERHAQYEKQLQAIVAETKQLEFEAQALEKLLDDKVTTVAQLQEKFSNNEKSAESWSKERDGFNAQIASLQKVTRDLASPGKAAAVNVSPDASKNIEKTNELAQKSESLGAQIEKANDENRLLKQLISANSTTK